MREWTAKDEHINESELDSGASKDRAEEPRRARSPNAAAPKAARPTAIPKAPAIRTGR